MRYYVYLILWGVLLSGCSKFNKKDIREPIARVNQNYLYKEDVKDLVPKGLSKEDSISIVSNYINNWATQQLFIDQAKRNLKESELKDFDELVEDYRNTLYINAYKDAVINKAINMQVTDQDLSTFYEENLENFNLNEDIVQLRYLHLPTKYNDVVATQRKLNRFNDEDKEDLEEKKLEYVEASLNDSVWVSFDQVLSKIPVLKKRDRDGILKEGKYVQQRDSTGLYMVKFREVLKRGEVAPIEYIKPTIRQIILNKRKRELIKNLEKDITKDAIKNKQFEVYN